MPDNAHESLEWNEENLAQVIADLYREAANNEALHTRLLTNPFEVLSERIQIPAEWRGGVFSRVKNQPTMVLNIPPYGGATTAAALPEGTTEIAPKPDYEIICSTFPVW